MLDRTDGKFISAAPFVKNITWAKGIDENGRPIYVDENRPGSPAQAADGKKGSQVFSVPSFLGGKNWMPIAYSQSTSCSTCRRTNGAWTSGMSRLPTRRALPISAPVSGIVGSPITWEQDGEQWVAIVAGWGGAVPLWGGDVAKAVVNINQGGSVWAFKVPKQLAAAN